MPIWWMRSREAAEKTKHRLEDGMPAISAKIKLKVLLQQDPADVIWLQVGLATVQAQRSGRGSSRIAFFSAKSHCVSAFYEATQERF
jgi:hypothetical protein